MKLISVVAPMYNEEGLVAEYCSETLKALEKTNNEYLYEIILVNDGSSDNTLMEMQKQYQKNKDYISIINLSRNFGLEGAVNAAMRTAIGDAVIVMDADLQDPPALILEMVKKWELGADIVSAVRISRKNDTLFKRTSANAFYGILDNMSGKVKIRRGAANFKLLNRKAVDIINQLPESNPVFRVTVPFVGLHEEYIEYERDKRYAGKTKYNLKSMVPYALDSITGISVEPLRKIRLGIAVSTFLFLINFILVFFLKDILQVTAIICSAMFFMFAILFFCVAVMGEYIAQIFIETKHRPISIINEHLPSDNCKKRKDTM